jgi:hypothetical protein
MGSLFISHHTTAARISMKEETSALQTVPVGIKAEDLQYPEIG